MSREVVSDCHLQQLQSLGIPPAQLLEPSPETQMDVATAFLIARSTGSEINRVSQRHPHMHTHRHTKDMGTAGYTDCHRQGTAFCGTYV